MQIYHLKPEDMLLNILLLSLLFPFCISNADIISQNETITDPNLIVSGKGYFALGFFSPGNSSYRYLGIWYHKLPGKTVVWVANRDNPINDSSGFVSLNSDGNLVLCNNHSEQLPLWSTNVSVKGTEGFFAQLQDSGNLVIIQKESKRIVWQSFDYPTDTMLPGLKLGLDMKLALNRALTSWRSQDDPGTGEWLYQLVPTGCPQLVLFHKGFNLTPYGRTAPWPWDTPELHDDVASYANNQDEIYYTFIPKDESVFTRLVTTSSGFVQRITWDNSSLQWRESPPEPKYKYGHCGPNSLINRNSVDSLECMCLPGYTPKSLKNWYLRDGSAGMPTVVLMLNGETTLPSPKQPYRVSLGSWLLLRYCGETVSGESAGGADVAKLAISDLGMRNSIPKWRWNRRTVEQKWS